VPAWLVLVLMILAAYRLTRLVAVDEFPPIARPRDAYVDRHPDGWFAYLITCPFCWSVWAAAVVTFAVWLTLAVAGPGMPLPVLVWAGVAGAVSLLYEVIERA
jgi:hypothetical protein